jgi:NADPH-dependent 2,4-dienoyl-CoA reductase/sulfur reductase-like enzyme
MKVVIVGASIGGFRALESLRRCGFEGEVVLVDAEPLPGYDRPPLSKGVLDGSVAPGSTQFLTADALKTLDATCYFGDPVVALDHDRQRVVRLDGREIEFDALILACGAAPVNPWGQSIPGVHTLRGLGDALRLRDDLSRTRSLAVVGGGLIGCEVAAVANAMSREVTVIEPEPALMQRALGPVLGAHVAASHARRGVEVRTSMRVKSMERKDVGLQVDLDDGGRLVADTVLVAVGAKPNVDWLVGSSVRVDDGILVDSTLRILGSENVFAIGDISRWPSRRYGRPLRLEHWTSAVEQARVVAQNLTGQMREYDGLPYFWSDQHGRRIQVAGLISPEDEIEFLEDEGPDKFVALAWRDGVLAAVACRGAARSFIELRQRLELELHA